MGEVIIHTECFPHISAVHGNVDKLIADLVLLGDLLAKIEHLYIDYNCNSMLLFLQCFEGVAWHPV